MELPYPGEDIRFIRKVWSRLRYSRIWGRFFIIIDQHVLFHKVPISRLIASIFLTSFLAANSKATSKTLAIIPSSCISIL